MIFKVASAVSQWQETCTLHLVPFHGISWSAQLKSISCNDEHTLAIVFKRQIHGVLDSLWQFVQPSFFITKYWKRQKILCPLCLKVALVSRIKWQKFWYTGHVYAVCNTTLLQSGPEVSHPWGWEKGAVLILKCDSKYWTNELKSSWPRKAYSFHQADSWYFANILALELTAEYYVLLRSVTLTRSNSLPPCVFRVGIRCYTIAMLGHNVRSWNTLNTFLSDNGKVLGLRAGFTYRLYRTRIGSLKRLKKNPGLNYYSRNWILFIFRGDNARAFQWVSMNLNDVWSSGMPTIAPIYSKHAGWVLRLLNRTDCYVQWCV